MRRSILLSLTLGMLAGGWSGVQAQTGGTTQLEAARERMQRVEALQRDLERAVRTLYARRALFDAQPSAARRDSVLLAQVELERTRLQLSRELQQMIAREVTVSASGGANPRVIYRPATPTQENRFIFQPSQPRGWLGISFSTRWEEASDAEGRRVWRFGAYPVIESVEPGSPAERAGLAPGDVLVAMGGRDVVRGSEPFSELLRPGATVRMQVKRGEELRHVNAQIVARPVNGLMIVTGSGSRADNVVVSGSATVRGGEPVRSDGMRLTLTRVPVAGSSSLQLVAGAELISFSGPFRGMLGADEGVLVLRVAPATPAARAGLQNGDVVLGVNGTPARNADELRRLLEGESSRTATLQLHRGGRPEELVLRW